MSRLAALGGLILGLTIASTAYAKWKPEYASTSPELRSWYEHQHNSRGEWCCNEADGHPFYGTYTFQPDGSIVAIDNGMDYIIKKHMVLDGHNPTGSAVWWFIEQTDGRKTYCFSPGSLS